jgi:RimJ/RimL family protein N-acetyltransferase
MLQLRLLEDNDMLLVESWLHNDHVKKWYEIPHMGVSIDDWIHEIRQRNGEFSWITYLIALWHGQPIGFCQYYKCTDSADEDFGALSLEGSYGIDYMIGEQAFIGKGLGKGMIALLADKIFSLPDAKRITADIDMENKASANALLSFGFTLLDAVGGRFVLPYEAWATKNAEAGARP